MSDCSRSAAFFLLPAPYRGARDFQHCLNFSERHTAIEHSQSFSLDYFGVTISAAAVFSARDSLDCEPVLDGGIGAAYFFCHRSKAQSALIQHYGARALFCGVHVLPSFSSAGAVL